MSKDTGKEGTALAGFADELDLEKYDVSGIASDLAEVANLPKALAATAGRAALVPLGVAVFTWLVFDSRMGWPLLPFAVIAAFLSLAIAGVLAVAIFTRRQVDKVNDASHAVLGVISDMHADLATLRSGQAELTVRTTASTLATAVVFPMIEEMAVETASTVLRGPLTSIARAAIGVPLGVMQKSIAAGIEALPLDALDATIIGGNDSDAADAADSPDGEDARVDGVDKVVNELSDRYQDIASSLDGLVAKVMNRSVVPFVVAMVAAAIPLLLWWLFGWAVS